MKANTMTTKAGIARRRVDIRTPSSAAKPPRADGAYSFAAPMQGWPFSLGLSGTSCRDVKTVRPNALRVKRKSYIAKCLLMSAFCTETYLSNRPDSALLDSRFSPLLTARCWLLGQPAAGADVISPQDDCSGIVHQPAQDRSMADRFVRAIATHREICLR